MKKPVCPHVHEKQPSIIKAFLCLLFSSPLHLIYKECFKKNIIFSAFKRKVIIINELQDASTILNDKNNNFPKSGFVNKVLRPLLRDSIFNTNGYVWERARTILKPVFGDLKIVKTFSSMQLAALDMIERLEDYSFPCCIDMEYEMSYVTADIILRTILSTKLNSKKAMAIIEAFNAYQVKQSRSMWLGAFGLPHSKKVLWQKGDEIRNALKEIIEPRFLYFRQKGYEEEQDILTELLKAQDPKSGEQLSLDEIVNHVTMLFLAGHETSASTLSWALYLVAFDEQVQQELYEEIRAVFNNRSRIDFENVSELKKVRNVILESLRLYPPVYLLPRQVYNTCPVGNVNIKPLEYVIGISPWLIHRNADNWDRPDEFFPERFNLISNRQKHKECQFIPFSKGKRLCIGEGFAMQEAILILAHLVYKFNFSIKPGWQPKPVARVTLRSKNGIKLMVSQR